VSTHLTLSSTPGPNTPPPHQQPQQNRHHHFNSTPKPTTTSPPQQINTRSGQTKTPRNGGGSTITLSITRSQLAENNKTPKQLHEKHWLCIGRRTPS
jgi:hypothetical protein